VKTERKAFPSKKGRERYLRGVYIEGQVEGGPFPVKKKAVPSR